MSYKCLDPLGMFSRIFEHHKHIQVFIYLLEKKIMKFLVVFLIFSFSTVGRCHEIKGFTLKQFQFLYKIFNGDFADIKKKEKVEKTIVKNETSYLYGNALKKY